MFSAATKWMYYDGTRWIEDELAVQKLAQELTQKQLKEAKKQLTKARKALDQAMEVGKDASKETKSVKTATSFFQFVIATRKTNRIQALMKEAKPSVSFDVRSLDKDPFLLNTPRGTVSLRECKIRAHDPGDRITKITNVSPGTQGSEVWNNFLNLITNGNQDLQLYLQFIAGMILVGKVFCENLIIAHGSGGNGKSTLFNAWFSVMGEYAGSLSAETLTVNCRKNKSPEYAELRGKRFIIAAELEEGMRLDTSIMKKLCSTDPIMAEKKFKDPFTFIPSHTVVLYTNHLPKVGTSDKGTWDRIVVLPFLANLRGSEGEVKNYEDVLVKEAGPSILLWMIQGARKFIEANYQITMPTIVTETIEKYREENDWLAAFLNERCEVGSDYSVRAGDLYTTYKDYCRDVNDYIRHVSDFKAALTGTGFISWKKTNAGAKYYGIRIKEEDFHDPDEDEEIPFD